MKSSLPAALRGLVNEVGFRLFAASVHEGVRVDELPEAAITRCVESAVVYVGNEQPTVLALNGPEVNEGRELGTKLADFFQQAEKQPVVVFPVFPGCGWLDECVGDVLAADVIFEIKAGDRSFRTIDLRQVLVYCALNSSAGTFPINRACLVNPRIGVFLEESLDELCEELAGRTAVGVLSDIVEFLSESPDVYMG
jgi:hypothetical protein